MKPLVFLDISPSHNPYPNLHRPWKFCLPNTYRIQPLIIISTTSLIQDIIIPYLNYCNSHLIGLYSLFSLQHSEFFFFFLNFKSHYGVPLLQTLLQWLPISTPMVADDIRLDCLLDLLSQHSSPFPLLQSHYPPDFFSTSQCSHLGAFVLAVVAGTCL